MHAPTNLVTSLRILGQNKLSTEIRFGAGDAQVGSVCTVEVIGQITAGVPSPFAQGKGAKRGHVQAVTHSCRLQVHETVCA